jgi:hypothetical protein
MLWLALRGGDMPPFPIHPAHPERICWGCEKYCPVNDLCCRETPVPHPVELIGPDWFELENPAYRQVKLEESSRLPCPL